MMHSPWEFFPFSHSSVIAFSSFVCSFLHSFGDFLRMPLASDCFGDGESGGKRVFRLGRGWLLALKAQSESSFVCFLDSWYLEPCHVTSVVYLSL